MKKRVLSIALALIMCLGLLPASALAADGEEDVPPSETAEPIDISKTGLDVSKDAPAETTVFKAGEGTITFQPAAGEEEPVTLILEDATISTEKMCIRDRA